MSDGLDFKEKAEIAAGFTFLFCLAALVICLVCYPLYKWVRADGKADYCYVTSTEWKAPQGPLITTYDLVAHRPWMNDNTLDRNLTSITEGSHMKTGKIATLAAIGLLAVVFVGSALGYRSDCVSAEAGLKAQKAANRSSYDAYWKTVREMSQVPAMYTEDMKKVYDSAITGRYGAGGSKAMFQFIKEHNPSFDSSLYTKIQTAIEAGRTRFNADQAQLMDKKRQYEVVLGSNSGAMVGWLFGFPKVDLSQFDVVTSTETEQAFTAGKAEEVKLR